MKNLNDLIEFMKTEDEGGVILQDDANNKIQITICCL